MEVHFGDYMLRSWREDDAAAVARYANNRKIWLNLRDAFLHPYALEDAKQFIAKALAMQPETLFAIATASEAIGSIGFHLGEDVHRFTAELGYWLAEPFWGRGITTQAIAAVTDFAFEKFRLTRLFAVPYASNPASARVLEKNGFHFEGTLKCSAFKDGKVCDQLMYAKTGEVKSER